MGKAITSMTSYLCGVRDGPTLRPARGKRMNVANEEVLPITKTNSQCAGSHGSGPEPELEIGNIGTGNTPILATLNDRCCDNWNIIREIQWPVASGQLPVVTDNVWGLDIDGTLQGAGGLLAVVRSYCIATNSSLVTRHSSLYFPTYDANGNICEYVTTNGEIVAHYDYSPFGEPLIESGELASSFTHRFSTKPWCLVTGLYEYQMRKYRPEIGRWLSRDVDGYGVNKYSGIGNNAILWHDRLGFEVKWIKHKLAESPPDGWDNPNWDAQTEFYYAPSLDTLVEYKCKECCVGYYGILSDFIIHSYFKDNNPLVERREKEHFDCFSAFYAIYRTLFIKATLICVERSEARAQLQKLKNELNEALLFCNHCNWKYDRPGGPHGH